MGRQPCCDNVGLKRGQWTLEEDQKLMNFIHNNGIQCWRLVPKHAGLLRCGKSCRLRWMNYLRPDLKRGAFSEAEEDQIIELHSRLGNRWSKIAGHFPGRTDNEIKNHWNTKIKKKLKLLGLDPHTHKATKQVEDCNAKESTLQPEPLKEVMSNEELKLQDNPRSEDYERNNGIDQCLSGQCTGLVHNKKTRNEDLDAESTLTAPAYQSGSFFTRIDEYILQEDSHQHWIDNVDSLLSWDSFNNLNDLFLFDNRQ